MPRKRTAQFESIPTEDQEQRAVCHWLQIQGLTYIHVPNGGQRARVEAAIFKALGVKPGFPDLIVFDPPPVGGYHGTVCELKRRGREREKNGGLSDAQIEWIERLRQLGWATGVCYGADDAIRFFESLGYGKRRTIFG